MKKIICLLLAIIMIFSLISCGSEYEPQESTEEEKSVVMTMSVDGEKYDIKYELYRAFFLTYKNEIDGGDASVWSSDKKDEYISKINEKIIASISEIYSAFHMCEEIGIDVFSKKFDKKIEEYISDSVDAIVKSVKDDEDREISNQEGYALYLESLKKINHNYSTHALIYRYELALAELESYYVGSLEIASPSGKDGKLEYTKADVEAYYNSDSSVRVIEAYLNADATNSESRAESIRAEMEAAAQIGIDSVAGVAIKNSMASLSDIKKGIVIGKSQLDYMYFEKYTEAAFALGVGEVSDVIRVDGADGGGYYIIYRCEKSAEHLNENYADVEYSYCYNKLSEMRAEIRASLKDSITKTDAYTHLVHTNISI